MLDNYLKLFQCSFAIQKNFMFEQLLPQSVIQLYNRILLLQNLHILSRKSSLNSLKATVKNMRINNKYCNYVTIRKQQQNTFAPL
jgi:hypothetical protein